ncbi:Dipeptide transport system permease protein DppC, partial [Geodia barretti]
GQTQTAGSRGRCNHNCPYPDCHQFPSEPPARSDPYESVGDIFLDPSREFPMGTDIIGRDVLSRVLYGSWISLYVAIGSVLIGISAGFVLGIVSTYAGGVVDLAIQRLIDALMSMPGLILALAIMAILGPSLNNVILAIVIGMIAPVVRTVRSQVLTLKEMDYVTAARAVGARPGRIVFRHIMPNCFAIYLIMATYYLGFAIIIEASLSFLGVGAPPDDPTCPASTIFAGPVASFRNVTETLALGVRPSQC